MNNKKDYKLSFLLGIIILLTNFIVITPIIFLQYHSSTSVFQQTLKNDFNEEVKLSRLFLDSSFNAQRNQTRIFSKTRHLVNSLEKNNYSEVRKILENFQNQDHHIDFIAVHQDSENSLIDVSLNLLEDKSIFTDYIDSSSIRGSQIKRKNNHLVFFSSAPITSPTTGRVLGRIHTGVIINNNLELINKISENLGQADIFLFHQDSLIVGTRRLTSNILKKLKKSKYETLLSLEENIFFKKDIHLGGATLTLVTISDKTILNDLRVTFLKALVFTIFITIILSISAVFIANKSLLPPLNRLLHYLENSVRDEEHKIYQKSSIKEFNLISESLSEVFKNLTRKKGQLHKVIDSSKLPSVILNDKLEVLRFNQTAEELFGISEIGQDLHKSSYLSKSFKFKELTKKTLNGQEIVNEEIIFKSKDNWCYTSWVMSLDKIENIIFAQCIDNTEKVLSVKEMEIERSKSIHNQKLAALGEVAGSIAHEVNNPMGVISLSLSLIEDEINSVEGVGPVKKELINRYLHNIDDSVTRTTSIVSHFLDFSRDSKKDKQEIKTVQETFDKTFIFIEEKVKRNKIDLKINIPNKKISFYIKETQFSQVMVNLINNSIDALENSIEKNIIVNTVDKEDSIEIHIIDSGPGISKDIVQTIFNPFFTTKPKGKGTGLGLSISKTIIEEMNGKLELESSSKGAHFVIHLQKYPTQT